MKKSNWILVSALWVLFHFSFALGSSQNYKLLIIDSQKGEPYKTVRETAMQELALLGLVDGKNLTVQYYSIGGYEGRLKSIWKKEADQNYDVIFVNGTLATKALKEVALDDGKSKIVFATITDPVGVGVITDFESPPKHNFTGISFPVRVDDRLRFVQKVMPNARKIGLIYADMPQSHSYRKWVEKALRHPDFENLEVIFRIVGFVKSEGGHKRMAMTAQKYIKELNDQVDVFLSPNDQMGAQAPFAQQVFLTATKPLVGLGEKDVMEGWGATFSISPDLDGFGIRAAHMIQRLFKGVSIREIIPEWPGHGKIAIDLKKAAKFGIQVPHEIIILAGENIVR